MLSRYAGELEDRQSFISNLVEQAETERRDLRPDEMELVTRTRDRIAAISAQMQPLEDAHRIAGESRDRLAAYADLAPASPARAVEYRSAGAYIIERVNAGLGNEDSRRRLELFHRAAAHQTTGDNPGLLPEQIIGPVLNFIDESRPLVQTLGPRPLPSGTWSRPQVTQHTQVAAQTAEKTELVSRKMVIGKLPVTAVTLGGYVNVSRQDIDWTQPGIMDVIIADLAGQYAIESENKTCDDLSTAAGAGTALPATPTSADIAAAFWAAVGAVYAATKGVGRVFAVGAPDMLGLLGPMFPQINPTNAVSSGFTAADYGSGGQGAISGVPVIISAGMDAGNMLVMSTASAEVYEDRIGALQVVEPSVLGVQVAYAGYFADVVISAAGIQKIHKAP
jgi:HK97 family phage major capsid protein